MSLGVADMTALVATCAAWAVLAVGLALNRSRRRPMSPSLRWWSTGLLLMATGAIPRQFAEVRHWPLSQLLALDTLQGVLTVAGLACGVVGITVRRRSQRP
jgi:hypothetical protein